MYRIFLFLFISILTVACDKTSNDELKEPEKIYAVGDYYNVDGVEGIVYKVTEDGKHGMILSKGEGLTVWDWRGMDIELAGCQHDSLGWLNVEHIKTYIGWDKIFPAFKWCDALNKVGEKDWFLPSPVDWKEIAFAYNGGVNCDFEAQDIFNKKITDNGGFPLRSERISGMGYAAYWTSCEKDLYEAVVARPIEGGKPEALGSYMKKYDAYVRAVRPF